MLQLQAELQASLNDVDVTDGANNSQRNRRTREQLEVMLLQLCHQYIDLNKKHTEVINTLSTVLQHSS